MLNTEFMLWEHKASGRQIHRAAAPYSVPELVAPHLDFVGGVLGFPGELLESHH